ncbi:MAG: peptidase M1 [Pseudopedobacter saltans]|uniref:Peptidase M1 n=1 Tax=Pseudopedobacter saltans TaxID=151895 RepID=A0A2W5F253_9SPHI|nr:MAG: peptidase M1 [Pseudopedobacter saltans]
MKRLLFNAVLLMFASATHAQYDQHKAFDPLFYTSNGNMYRSASGQPGPNYWQNRADYKVVASFDTSSLILKGNVEIDYTNNSGDSLPFLWLELSQNIDKKNSRLQIMDHPSNQNTKDDNGFRLGSVQVFQNGKWATADYIVNDTRLQIRLKNTLAGKSALKLKIDYSFDLLQSAGGDRSGYMDTENGRIYEFSYWYPRMCVYDDLVGWNTLPFVGNGEMYMDYGNIDYTVTVPAGLLMVGSGNVINPTQVYSQTILQRLKTASQSEGTVVLHGEKELGQSVTAQKSGNVTWHFKMENTRDVAWAISKAWIWDAANINLPSGKKALAQSVYPLESVKGDSGWTKATEYLKASVEIFSKKWFEFPYPVAVNVGGPIGGMEFPALAFDHWNASGKDLWMLVSHEIGHSWYPMIVGSNERKNAWMDEGFNTFVDIYAQEEYNKGQFAPKRDGEYAPKGGNPSDEILPIIASKPQGPYILTAPDAMPAKDIHPLAYFKTAFGLVLLREVILGKERFDYAFRQYTHDWAFKHPSPMDFFCFMDNGVGEDLSWFWKGWFLNNWQLDQAISKVDYIDNDPRKGIEVTIENLQQLPMPVPIEVVEANGIKHVFQLPVEIWQRGGRWTFTVPTTQKIQSITLDPAHLLPDIDRGNNIWKG